MPTREDMCSVLESYVTHLSEHDIEELNALFAEDAVKHEPLGRASHHGREAIRSFDVTSTQHEFSVTRHSAVTASGNFAAMQVLVKHELAGEFLATDLFEFNEQGQIASLSVLIDLEARP